MLLIEDLNLQPLTIINGQWWFYENYKDRTSEKNKIENNLLSLFDQL